MGIALACDVRLGIPTATFNAAFARLGLSGADIGVSYFLPRLVGLGLASELMLTGRLVDADEASRIGLVNRVVPAAELLESCYDIARLDGLDWTGKVGVLANLTLGGIGTTGFVFASALLYLADKPDERARLVAEPKRLRTAIDEFLRFFAASPHDGRRVMRPAEIAGVAFGPGDYVILSFGAASRDPAIFDRPDDIDLGRPLPNRHLAFGSGIHHCIGSHLAKLELLIGLEVFLREVPDYALAPDFTPAYQISNTRVLERLPVVVG